MHRPQTPQPGFGSITLLQKFTPHFKILDPHLIWKGWFLERGKSENPEKILSEPGREPTTNSYHFILYLKNEKGTPFGRNLPTKAIIGSTGPHSPGEGKQVPGLTTTPLLFSFQRQKPIHLLYFFFLLYLHKKVTVVVPCRPV